MVGQYGAGVYLFVGIFYILRSYDFPNSFIAVGSRGLEI
jgi:hypothetical protein